MRSVMENTSIPDPMAPAKPENGTRRSTDYTEQDVARALNAMVAFGGALAPAARALQDTFELTITTETLKSWRDHRYAERYANLRQEHGEMIEQAMVAEVRDIARMALIAERMAVERVIEELERVSPRVEPSQAAVNMSKVKATNVSNLLALTGRPERIVENRSAEQIIRALEAKGVIETPEQLPAAE